MASESIAAVSRTCQICGDRPARRKFCQPCGDEKKRLAQNGRKRVRVNSGHKPVVIDCVVCGKSVERVSVAGRDAGLCCSRECGFERHRQRCRASRSVTTEKAIYARWSRRANAPPKVAKVQLKRCRECGTVVGKGQQRCEPCRIRIRQQRRASEASRVARRSSPARRRDKAYRKALERGRVAGAERFDPYEVFERDGWRCHLCRRSTPKRLRGSYAPNAPELDHIVPLSKGGAHTRANTACACRACNGAKADRVVGQPSLLALLQ